MKNKVEIPGLFFALQDWDSETLENKRRENKFLNKNQIGASKVRPCVQLYKGQEYRKYAWFKIETLQFLTRKKPT